MPNAVLLPSAGDGGDPNSGVADARASANSTRRPRRRTRRSSERARLPARNPSCSASARSPQSPPRLRGCKAIWSASSGRQRPPTSACLAAPDPRMKGDLAAWLWRANALEGTPTGIAEPYAMEISGDWQGAARAWQDTRMSLTSTRSCSAGTADEPDQREALAIFEQLGAAPAAEALRRELRSRGIRGVPRGQRSSTQEHPFGLTRREAQILALMRDGLRNAAIARAPVSLDAHGRPSCLGDSRQARRAIPHASHRDRRPKGRCKGLIAGSRLTAATT
jgi:hypothetical protein